jgi:uncharacterized membrane protein YphA (DoxX/SURF4 family)
MVHLQNGFFMNWMGTQKGEGFEFHLLALAMAVALLLRGAGAFSLDRGCLKVRCAERARADLALGQVTAPAPT